jgi:hypothetical protein
LRLASGSRPSAERDNARNASGRRLWLVPLPNPNGRYRFDVSALPAGQLRPLRERTDSDERAARPSPPILVNGDKH